MVTRKEKWLYLTMGIGSGIIISGMLMSVVGVKVGQEYNTAEAQYKMQIEQLQLKLLHLEETITLNNKVISIQDQLKDQEISATENASDSSGNVETQTDEIVAEQLVIPEEIPVEKVYRWVTIPSTYGSNQIAALLYREGIVDDAEIFHDYIKTQEKTKRLRTGKLKFPEKATYNEILNVLLGKNNE